MSDEDRHQSDRLDDLESSFLREIAEIKKELSQIKETVKAQRKDTRRLKQSNSANFRAVLTLLCFLLLMVALGLRLKEGRWEWELKADTVAGLIQSIGGIAAISGTGAAAYFLSKPPDEKVAQQDLEDKE